MPLAGGPVPGGKTPVSASTGFPFIDLTTPPDGWEMPDAEVVDDTADLWVGMASSVAIEEYTDLPPDPQGLKEAAALSDSRSRAALRGCVNAWEHLTANPRVDETALRACNHLILGDNSTEGGAWRTVPVYVTTTRRKASPTGDPNFPVEFRNATEVVYEPPPAEQVPEMMERYLDRVDRWSNRPMMPWWAHLMLVLIHPWEDGNGRTARLLEAHLFRRQGRPAPWAATRNNWPRRPMYYEALNETRHQVDADVFYGHQFEMRERPGPERFERNPRFVTGKAVTILNHRAPGPQTATQEERRKGTSELKRLVAIQAAAPEKREEMWAWYWASLLEDD